MGPTRRLGHRREIVRRGAVRRDQFGGEAGHRHDQHDQHAKRAKWLASAKVQRGMPERPSEFDFNIRDGGDCDLTVHCGGHGAVSPQAKRIRGSSQPYSRSTTRLVSTKTVTVSITNAWVSV